MNKKHLIVICGPTASGKTDLALKLSAYFQKSDEKLTTELVNADSMQVYKGMDIGTNKGDVQKRETSSVEIQTVKIEEKDFLIEPFSIENSEPLAWLFDLAEPSFNFTVAHYQALANLVIKDVFSRGSIPILVGGTGLYIDSVTKQYSISTEPDSELRNKLEDLSTEELQKRLEELGFDLLDLNNSDRNNPRRLIRWIEKLENKGKSKSLKENELQEDTKDYAEKIFDDVVYLYPEFDREELFLKIDKRSEKMIKEGLIDEVQYLLNSGYGPELKSMQSTGYKQVVQYLKGEILSKKELVKAISKAHRDYAKRQMTWFEGKGRGYKLQKINAQKPDLQFRSIFGKIVKE